MPLTLIDFTLSNNRRFYSSMWNPSGVKGLTNENMDYSPETLVNCFCYFIFRIHEDIKKKKILSPPLIKMTDFASPFPLTCGEILVRNSPREAVSKLNQTFDVFFPCETIPHRLRQL